MNIAINCRSFLNKRYTGIGRYAYHLVKTLTEIDDRNNYMLYAKKGLFNLNKRLPKFGSKNVNLITDRFNRGIEKSLSGADIYHSPSPDFLTVNGGAKIVVTVHDLIFKTYPQGHTQRTIDETEKKFEKIGERATKIICCSKNTVRDLRKYFKVKRSKISLIYQGVDKNLFYVIGKEEEAYADQMLKAKGVKGKFILSVGTIEPRKNLENILHAFDRLRTKYNFKGKLVVIGMKGWLSDSIYTLIRKLELKNQVLFLGYLSDQDIRCFYNKAEAFLFPSFYEGFGFPIVEAFCCGTPVITSNVSSCPEIAQDAAIITNPNDSEDIAEATARIMEDHELRQTLRNKGFQRAGDFNFRKTAAQTLEVYKQAFRK